MKETKPQFIVCASVTEQAQKLHKKFRSKGINFSPFVDQLIFKIAKKNKIE